MKGQAINPALITLAPTGPGTVMAISEVGPVIGSLGQWLGVPFTGAAGASGASVLTLGIAVVVAGGCALAMARPLNALTLGERTAASLGINVKAATWIAIVAASLLASASVAASGVIGFVGLVAPHLVRLRWGSDYRTLLPLAALAGATLMVLSDLLARVVIAPTELPIGVVTALIGVPVFLQLLMRKGAA